MRLLVLLALTAFAAAAPEPGAVSAPVARTVEVGHGLSIRVPAGWRVSHRRFTPCADPVERFSLLGRGHMLTVEERLAPQRSELTRRPRRFRVQGGPAPLECCAIQGRRGWLVRFGDHGRAFYAYLYPGGGSPRPLLRSLDSLRLARG